MKQPKAPPLDLDALVPGLEVRAPAALAAAATHARSWFAWRAPRAGAAARRQLLHVLAGQPARGPRAV